MAKRTQAQHDEELPRLVRFGRAVTGELDEAERREWWLANGLGGYAAGTLAGTLTRRYHGLLIAPVEPPLGRRLLFAKADATLIDGERRYPLFANRWAGGAIDPRGFTHLESFHLDGRTPVWRCALGRHLIESRIWMEPGVHATYLAYRLLGPAHEGRALKLAVRLLVNARDHHHSASAGAFMPEVARTGDGLAVRYPGGTVLHFAAPRASAEPAFDWYENFDLPVERERGLSDRDSHLCVGTLDFDLRPGAWTGFLAALGEGPSPDIEAAMGRVRSHEQRLLAEAKLALPEFERAPDWVRQLVLAADSFIFARPLADLPDGQSVIAGYPWFGDWGRDTMIALPGLTIACGRPALARTILETFARFVDRGMLPNVFPGAGEVPEYNTVDAALWYIEAWRAYLEASADIEALKRVFPVLESIIDSYRTGTRYGIRMDPADGLITAGEPGVQLTWMDAKIGDWVVTPRTGKAVEINALWHNALHVMADFAARLKRSPAPYLELAERARRGFQRYLGAKSGGLYDVLDGPEGNDPTLRPNQIFAVSLPHSPLEPEAQAQVVATVADRLLTSYGLRSLEASHPSYRGRYEGGVWERDSAYHQGPVWAWLLGHYALAEYRVSGDAELALSRLEPIRDHLFDGGLGTVSEILDGDPPHRPRGAPAQAWSVACTLDAWVRLERARLDRAHEGRRAA